VLAGLNSTRAIQAQLKIPLRRHGQKDKQHPCSLREMILNNQKLILATFFHIIFGIET